VGLGSPFLGWVGANLTLMEKQMVQAIRPHEEPLYSCTVLVETLTAHPDEEVVSFGNSPENAREQAQQLLISHYGCPLEKAQQLAVQGTVEALSPWCAASDR
jgi:hypothetical protein